MIPAIALCLHRPSVAEFTVSMAELFAVVEVHRKSGHLRFYLSPFQGRSVRPVFTGVKFVYPCGRRFTRKRYGKLRKWKQSG